MLEQLAKRDKDWRRMAYQICGDRMTADDLVQDMYLKFANYKNEMNEYYVFFAIRSIHINNLKKRKIETVSNEIENLTINDEPYCFENDFLKEMILKEVNDLPYFERETLKVSQIISQRELARQSEIPFETINKTIKKTKQQLKEIWDDQKKLKD
jgi:RNA polymerase sigma factor (sigma-70 family)